MKTLENQDGTSAVAGESDLVIVIPVYDDWEVVQVLLAAIESELAKNDQCARVLLIDDGSSSPCPDVLVQTPLDSVERLDVLELRRNLGHQRALAIGLSFVESEILCRAAIVMDGDGEDSPTDIPRLIQRMEETGASKVIFAARTRRSEGALFTCFYAVYRCMHLILTGIQVRVGNFSIVPRQLLKRLVVVSNLWSHFAAAVHEAQLPLESIPTKRAVRLGGTSKMNFVALVTHGLSAMAVFGSRIGVRMLIATSVLTLITFAALITAVLLRGFTDLPIPGGTTYAVGLLVVILLQMMMFSAIFVFLILASRGSSGFLPIRDYKYFVAGFRPVQATS